MPSKMWDEIAYSFQNFIGKAVEVWEWIHYFIPQFVTGLKLIHVKNRGPSQFYTYPSGSLTDTEEIIWLPLLQ